MENRDEVLVRAQTIIKELRERLAAAEHVRPEPVAIVGMACRFPDASAGKAEDEDLESFWRMTLAGGSAERAAPQGRWIRTPCLGAGKERPFVASFLKDIDLFDAGFFDIPSSEAMEMDPAQRLFLEVAWHALQDAGQAKERLAGSDTGVFVGHTGFHEYLRQHMAAEAEIGVYTGTGSGQDVIAGRLAYFLNLHGPAMTVNTACSSSLVAVHLARRSLLAGECRMAVAGGVNILGPVSTALATQMGFMAADGRCKTFDERANGFGRGEGCGVVVLKRLSDAEADGDPVHALIHGSAMNQDGRTNGLSAPNGRSQAALLRRALHDAKIEASQVGYVEAHGTGTSLGDLIEFGALAEVYGVRDQSSLPCALGSAKANIGHQESAAGAAGLIRAALTIEHGVIPPLAGFRTLNPDISLEGTRLTISSQGSPWSDRYQARYAGVSSFGWSGTNAHVVLGEAPTRPDKLFESKRRLPPYPFQRSRYWIPTRESATEEIAPDDWFYEVVWKEMPLPMPHANRDGQARNEIGTWLIFADETGVAHKLARAVAGRGDSFLLIRRGTEFRQISANEFEADAKDGNQIERLLRSQEIVQADRLFVLYLQALDLDLPQIANNGSDLSAASAIEDCMGRVVGLFQGLAEGAANRSIKLWIVTRGAQAIHAHNAILRLEQSPVHGFGAAAALEHPELWGGVIDLSQEDNGDVLMQECETARKENRVAYRNGRRFVPRLCRATPPPPAELRLNVDATYLVTGAFGGIGLDLAEWLAESGAKHLVLLGRSARSGGAPETQSALRRLKEAGVNVIVERGDVADFAQMSDLLAQLRSEVPPIRGIVHAAAEVIWKPIVELDANDVQASFRSKVRGPLVLHELTKGMALDFLVFFSSAAVSIGARNAAAYAAANSFMDALAFERRSAGLPGLSIQWGHWQRRIAHSGVAEEQFTASGLPAMAALKAFNALARLLRTGTDVSGSRQSVVAQIDVDQLKAGIAARSESLFLSDLDGPKGGVKTARSAAMSALEGWPEAERVERLTMLVSEQLRRAMDWSPSQPVDVTRGFFNMGIDSLKSIQFKNYIEAATGTVQSSTLVFLYPNVTAVAEFLDRSLFGGDAQQNVFEASSRSESMADKPPQEPLTDAETRVELLAELELFRGGQHG